MTTLLSLCSTLLLLLTTQANALHAGNIACGDDWAEEASAAHSSGTPIMLVFTSEDCSYCERLKSELLEPMLQAGELTASVRLREFNIDRGGKITDFDGERIRSRIFVSRYDIFATPTVVLLDHLGEPLAPPIVGFDNADHYRVVLNQAIEIALPHRASTERRATAGVK